MDAMLAAQEFTPHTARTVKAIIFLTIGATLIFRQRLLYFAVYGVIILFVVTVVVGIVAIAQLL
jgi:hypothetical protein